MNKEGIAIVGVGCRFPGKVADMESYWKLLAEGREAVGQVPADRWNLERYYDAEAGILGKSIASRGGFVESLEQFDPQFFGISPREAPFVDPQHRLLLETAWEAIEDAGLVLDFEKGTDLAVYVGISHNDYQIIQASPYDSSGISPHTATGSAHSIAANRISYCLNLTGPSVAMDTACSSALTAVHAACEHIWSGRGEVALAGGVTIMINPGGFIGFSQASMLSPDGRCKAFDASANGFVRGEGAGMVLLKPLSKAIADGDPIHGVVVGTSINQDGHTNGISLPSPEAQARLVRDACRDAGVDPSKIGFVEAHGTGTAVGDPIEATALAEALCAGRASDDPLPIGSVKTNLGHLETAAGVAGLLKALLVLKHHQIPPSLHFETPSPHIDFPGLKLRVPTSLEPFPAIDGERLVGVNSFGFGGANAHVIVSEAPARPQPDGPVMADGRSWPLVLSARSEEALRGNAARVADWLEARSNANGSTPLLPDLTYTLGARRNHHQYRMTLVPQTMPEAIEELRAYAAGSPGPKVQASFTPRPEQAPKVGFVMSGQGPQWWGMGRELMKHEPVFRATMERCAEAMKPWARFSLLEELARTEETSQVARTEVGQPAIFAMQVSLAALWQSWGVNPAAVVGHSVGEVAAACVAGIFSIEDGARIIVQRARFMEDCARGEGTMLAVGLSEEEARAVIARHDRTVSIAAFNGPRSLTMAGPRVSLEAIQSELEGQGVFARLVKVDHPFHHALMQPAADALVAAISEMKPLAETVPFFSTVTGERCSGESCDAAHWGRGIRQPVLFAPAVNALADHGVDVWLEISAHPALAHSIQECLTARGVKAPVLSSIRREREHDTMLETVTNLHRNAVEADFSAITPSRRQLALPAYAWDRSRWWSESPDWKEGRLGKGGRGLLDTRLPRATPTWSARLDSRHMAFLKDHKVESHVIFPAAGFVELVLEAGVQLFEGRPFAVEDFEIRKPLILPENPSSIQLEVTYDSNERTFTIQSKFENAASWSVHVVGTMRSERTESTFAGTDWESASQEVQGLEKVDLTHFYDHMADKGLRYGEEFRGVRELAAAGGRSSGRVALTEASAVRAGEYQLHPVLMDGALHVFSAGARTVEGRKARLKLPVRFARILFLRSPGASCKVEAGVQGFNDEYLQGRLGIYDEAGNPCVLVDGFRAIAVAGVRRSGSPGGIRDLIYSVGWERKPLAGTPATLEPLPLSRLKEAAGAALDEVVNARGRAKLEAALAAGDTLAAAHLTQGLRKMGAGDLITAEALGVAPALQPVFGQLMTGLVLRGLVDAKDGGYVPTAEFDRVAASADDTLREYVEQHPGHLPEALLCVANCAELTPILRGEKEAVQVLFGGSGADLLDQFYGDGLFTCHWLAAIAATVQEAAKALPEGRGLRILEIGAGTGGLASYLLPQLERGLHSYTFTDISASFFSGAMQKLAGFPEVEYRAYDLERSPAEQDYELGSYDFVIGTNCVHAVGDVREALGHLRDLLAPGGSLVFMDTASPQLWTETVFGLTSGWWSLTDRELRPVQPLMEREQWEKVLKEVGFDETASLPGLTGPRGGEGQIGVLGRKAWTTEVAPAEIEEATAEEGGEGVDLETSWLVFADAGGLGDQLVSRLREAGARCRVVTRGGAYASDGQDQFTVRAEAPEDWTQLVTEVVAEAAPERFVYLWTLDEPAAPAEADDVLGGTDALLHLAQAQDSICPASKVRMDLITRGAQSVGEEIPVTSVAQSPAIGIARVIHNEQPSISCRCVDLPPVASEGDVDLLLGELGNRDAEREVAFRGEARYAMRLTRGRSVQEQWLDASVPLRLESKDRGHLDALAFAPFEQPACGPDDVVIDVMAAGMNFRDVLKALALYPGEAPDARIFGDEVAGIITAVGANVDHVQVGDRAFGLAVFGMATQTLARGCDVRVMPPALSFEEAATLPVVFMTSWHSLVNVARMRAGETILVHAGAGGVGMAAIQIARHLGVDVIASAGSATKRALLLNMGVKHVIDSRRGDFVEAVMALTDRRGVDVVLNALASEAIPMGLACLSEFGRFIEIGKRDIYQNSRIPLWPLRNNASFHVVAMDAVFSGDGRLARQLLADVTERVEQGELHPLPFRAFPACRVDAAFRQMAQGKHIGKVVVSFAPEFVSRRGEAPVPAFEVRPDGAYLITGAFGGFGRVLANWLVEAGARHLVMSSRSGLKTPGAEAFVQGLEAKGVEVLTVSADVGSKEDVARLFTEIGQLSVPLKGVLHLAMVIDDAPLGVLNRDRMKSVLTPKSYGGWLLHEQTTGMDLDCFLMFSSVSSVFGNPAQANYAAANAFLDSLAHHRRALGLPALTVNWGVLGGEGYVARNEKVAEFLARQGTAALSPGEVVTLLEGFLATGTAQGVAIRVDWNKWRQFFRGMQENPLLERIFASGMDDQEAGGGTSDWRLRIESASADEREGVIGAAVRDVVGGVLRVKPDSLRNDQPLTDLGLDSLMGVEIENSLEAAIGVALPPTSLMRARTIGQIVTLISERVGGKSGAAPAASAAPAVVETPAAVEEVDIESLSDEDLDRLLGDDSSDDVTPRAGSTGTTSAIS
ncbi:type I polyketide synthase [Verrucomicrobium sp. BvORR034]|uniref:type I polyketide synthase n=1 Tax=Verrucomicrobium sp. BvORR034 TaxID=1396418 RepID=UPI002240E9AE|nr:type I polyketide synthase [Verrucomicrobium sp. BvORR034]